MIEALQALVAIHGTEVGARLDTMRPLQRQAIAEAAYDHGVIPVMDALNVPIAAIERAMRDSGFEQCAGECEAWFGAIELDDNKRCPDCATSDEFAEHQAEMKAADEARGLAAIEGAVRMLDIEEIQALQRGDLLTIARIEREIAAAQAPVEEPEATSGN